nr:hypothetical protein GCM10020092_053760 [Actinoplanes digitatis]
MGGLKDLRWYGRAWSSKSGLDALALSDAERDRLADGCYDPQTARVTATGLLEFPAALPFLDGMEPYTNLLKRLRTVVADPAAIVTFPYDWRLPVTVNSGSSPPASAKGCAPGGSTPSNWRRPPCTRAARPGW